MLQVVEKINQIDSCEFSGTTGAGPRHALARVVTAELPILNTTRGFAQPWTQIPQAQRRWGAGRSSAAWSRRGPPTRRRVHHPGDASAHLPESIRIGHLHALPLQGHLDVREV